MNNTFAFFGTPEVSSETLEILFAAGYTPSIIVTSPDRRSGRGMHITETPVGTWAAAHRIECLKPEKIDQAFIEDFKKYKVDLSIVIAYGKILPEELIKMPKLGTINIHYSLLPKYRGASPVEEALLRGDIETGVSIQQMEYKLDSGPIIGEKVVKVENGEIKTNLLKRLTNIGGELLRDMLPDIFSGSIFPTLQDESAATFCKKLKKEDGLLDLTGDPKINWGKYRAFQEWPGTYFFTRAGTRVKIKKAKYENNSFIIELVIPEGKKEVNFDPSILK